MSYDGVNGGSIGPSPAPPPSGGPLSIAYDGSLERYMPWPGFLRIDFQISGGDVYLQLKETIDRRDWPDVTQELFCPEGTHSIPLVVAAYGWRMRASSSTSGVSLVYARTFGA